MSFVDKGDTGLTFLCHINTAFVYVLKVGVKKSSLRPKMNMINARNYLFMIKSNKKEEGEISFKKKLSLVYWTNVNKNRVGALFTSKGIVSPVAYL